MIYLATNTGLVVGEPSGRVVRSGLEGQQVTSVIAREGVVLAGTRRGIFRSDDQGQTWREASAGLSQRYVRWLGYHPQISDLEFAGTEPAGIFISRDGANSWRECAEVAALRDQHDWFLPYSPGAGCVRGFAFHGQRAYAAVEVGGMLRSDDGGETWQLAQGSDGSPDLKSRPSPLIFPDVHSVAVHPSSPDLVFAPTGDGFYRSTDGGKSWECLYDCYCRAVWLDPASPDHLILGPADDVDANGRIEETRDGGKTWRHASTGLDTPWPRHMVERFTPLGGQLLAVLSSGQLIAAALETLNWGYLFPEITGIRAVAEAA